jgi:hypothetical protein
MIANGIVKRIPPVVLLALVTAVAQAQTTTEYWQYQQELLAGQSRTELLWLGGFIALSVLSVALSIYRRNALALLAAFTFVGVLSLHCWARWLYFDGMRFVAGVTEFCTLVFAFLMATLLLNAYERIRGSGGAGTNTQGENRANRI